MDGGRILGVAVTATMLISVGAVTGQLAGEALVHKLGLRPEQNARTTDGTEAGDEEG